MSALTPQDPDPPTRPALKAQDDAVPAGSAKAVQIADAPQAAPDDPQPKKVFTAGVGRKLSGRPPPPRLSSSQPSLENASSIATTPSLDQPAQDPQPTSEARQRASRVSEKLLAQVADWLEHEKTKKEKRKTKKACPRRKSPPHPAASPPNDTPPAAVAPPKRERSLSMDSESSDVSLDRLQRILDDSMAAFGLSSVPGFAPRPARRRSLRKARTVNLKAAASSDTEYADGDALVPACDVFLDNSKAPSNLGGKPEGKRDESKKDESKRDESERDESKRDEKEALAGIAFKNDIIRLAHTLKLKGWRRVPLDSGDRLWVERLSGALTNAVYVVCPPDRLDPGAQGRKSPTRVLLRVYGPQVDIDRDNELSVLRRLARKKIGPRVLGTFRNGRFEQYFDAITLTPPIMREPETSRQIAKRMRELHDGIELLDDERAAGPQLWKNWDRWLDHVERTVLALDRHVLGGTQDSIRAPGTAWRRRGLVCGVEWPVFKSVVAKYRRHLDGLYGGSHRLRERLVFSHNDTQYGNILRLRPDNKKSPLLQPANEHKQLIVIDFEYAGANVPGLEFANHFTEWTYNYHDPDAPFSCSPAGYPTPEEQYRFVKAYVSHRPQFPHPGATPTLAALQAPVILQEQQSVSTGSIADFMLDARAPPGASTDHDGDEARREEETDRRTRELMEETRLWRIANSAHWVAWGIVQAKLPGLLQVAAEADADAGVSSDDEICDDEFDYLSYAQERAFFFWGDCVLAGLVQAEELPPALRERIKLVHH